jgi:hypothetical protein
MQTMNLSIMQQGLNNDINDYEMNINNLNNLNNLNNINNLNNLNN